MREFSERDFPPFLNEYEADHTTCVGVETTLAEMAALGYSLAYADDPPAERGSLNARFLQTYGNRRVFAIINFPRQSVEKHTSVFIEVQDDRDAEALRQSLQDQLETEVEVEVPDSTYHITPDLEGYRWYQFNT